MAKTAMQIADHIIYYCKGDNCECCDWSDEDRAALEAMPLAEADRITTAGDVCIGCGAATCEDALCKQNHADDAEERLYDEAERSAFDYSDDGDALASAGWGTDEDYGYFGGED